MYACACVRGQVGDPVRAGETRGGAQPDGGRSQVRPNICLLFCLFFLVSSGLIGVASFAFAFVCVCVCVCLFLFMYLCMCVVYVCMYVCMHACMYACIV